MIDRKNSDTTPNRELLELFERLTDLMLNWDRDGCERLVADDPQYTEDLHAVLPAIRVMEDAKTGDSTGMAGLPHDDPVLSLKGRLGDF